jgi:hypothetical protein
VAGPGEHLGQVVEGAGGALVEHAQGLLHEARLGLALLIDGDALAHLVHALEGRVHRGLLRALEELPEGAHELGEALGELVRGEPVGQPAPPQLPGGGIGEGSELTGALPLGHPALGDAGGVLLLGELAEVRLAHLDAVVPERPDDGLRRVVLQPLALPRLVHAIRAHCRCKPPGAWERRVRPSNRERAARGKRRA